MSGRTKGLRSTVPGLALEALMVVFAVLVALGFEEWRDERQMRQFADRVHAAVIAEVQANLEEFRTTGPGLRSTQALLSEVLSKRDISALEDRFSLTFPDFSSAAWRAAQASQAAPYLNYDWVIQVSRAYEAYDIYARIADQIIDATSSIMGGSPTLDGIGAIQGRLVILTEVHRQVEERLELLLADRP
jgi:hypothetical protein